MSRDCCLCHREGHNKVLDMATVSFGLISQRADVGLVCAAAPQAASCVCFEGQSQELSTHKLPLHRSSSAAVSRSE